ncbi:surfactant protein C-like [Pelodytes ibericus]
MNEKTKTWAWGLVILMLLAIIVVGATLIGVYMTQKHTEAVIEMAFHARDGEKVQQTVMVNDKENVAAFYVNANNVSSTILYDYNHDIIGFRRMNSSKCFVMHMDPANTPKMEDILKGIRHFHLTNSTGENSLAYDIAEGPEANRTKLGITMNILCADVPIYWGTQSKYTHLRWKLTMTFSIFGFQATVKFES